LFSIYHFLTNDAFGRFQVAHWRFGDVARFFCHGTKSDGGRGWHNSWRSILVLLATAISFRRLKMSMDATTSFAPSGEETDISERLAGKIA